MKYLIATSFSLLLIFQNISHAGSGWYPPDSSSVKGKITAVQPVRYTTGTVEGGYPIFVTTNINRSSDCNAGNVWAIRSDLDDGNRLYSAVLTALTTGVDVQLYQWSCYSVGGKNYARIGGVKLLKNN